RLEPELQEVTSDRTSSPEAPCDLLHKPMTADGDLDEMISGLRAFAIPMPVRFRGITVREGALIQGPPARRQRSRYAAAGPKEWGGRERRLGTRAGGPDAAAAGPVRARGRRTALRHPGPAG